MHTVSLSHSLSLRSFSLSLTLSLSRSQTYLFISLQTRQTPLWAHQQPQRRFVTARSCVSGQQAQTPTPFFLYAKRYARSLQAVHMAHYVELARTLTKAQKASAKTSKQAGGEGCSGFKPSLTPDNDDNNPPRYNRTPYQGQCATVVTVDSLFRFILSTETQPHRSFVTSSGV